MTVKQNASEYIKIFKGKKKKQKYHLGLKLQVSEMLSPERKAGTQFAELQARGHMMMFKSKLRNKKKGERHGLANSPCSTPQHR